MSKTFEEHVGIGVDEGPTVRMDYGEEKFTVSFADATKGYFQNELEILHEKYRTIGEGNRGYLHERLDDFIDRWMRGDRTVK